jgi:membrane protein implicated in regulation of membrane protease activity
MGPGAVGRLGEVVHRIRGGEDPGEVRVLHDGIAHDYLAYCPQPLPLGQQVLVINERGARQIDVEPWVRPGLDAAGVAGT